MTPAILILLIILCILLWIFVAYKFGGALFECFKSIIKSIKNDESEVEE